MVFCHFQEYIAGDEFSANCRISFALEQHDAPQEGIEGPGQYVVSWRR